MVTLTFRIELEVIFVGGFGVQSIKDFYC